MTPRGIRILLGTSTLLTVVPPVLGTATASARTMVHLHFQPCPGTSTGRRAAGTSGR